MTAEDETQRRQQGRVHPAASGLLESSRCLVRDNGEVFLVLNNENCFCINLRDYSLETGLPWFKKTHRLLPFTHV